MNRTRSRRLAGAALTLLLLPLATLVQASEERTPQDAYARFRRWVNEQPRDLTEDATRSAYRAHLQKQGLDTPEIDAEVELLQSGGRNQEVEMWNRVLTAEEPRFNTEPNDFLVRMVEGVEPGRALDVGMGQGRNAIYLAGLGWEATGFDPADKAVALAQELAAQAGVEITTRIEGAEEFDFGTDQWDLIVLSYVSARSLVGEVVRSLRPGGRVVLEAFHDDATKGRSIGRGVVYDNNELLELFSELRIVRYEDELAVGDFGLAKVRIVRLAAEKP